MSGEKTEEATEKKKRDAKEKGQVAVSKDAQTLGKLLFFYIIFFAIFSQISERFEYLYDEIVQGIFSPGPDFSGLVDLAIEVLLWLTWPFVLACVLAALGSTWIQTGLVIAPKGVTPSFKKFNAVSTIKSMFSKKSFVQLFLSLVKLVVLSVVVMLLLAEYASEIIKSYLSDLNGIFVLLGFLLKVMVYSSLAIFIVLSIVDWIAVFLDHKKNLKMSKNEVKDEQKQMYGNAQIKQARKQEHRNLINSSLQNMSEAKAVVANPTHISVALGYEPGVYDIPFILTMGEDDGAKLIRDKADELGIPIIRSVALARMIYADCEEGEYIHEEHFELAAEALRIAMSMRLEQMDQTSDASGDSRN